MRLTCVGCLALAVLQWNVALADLTWLETTTTVHAGLADQFTSAAFRFENRTQTPVKILEVRSSCGCAAAKLAKKEFLPGEVGKIEVKLRLGGETGEVERSVLVKGSQKRCQPRMALPLVVQGLRARRPIRRMRD